ncbi:MAG: 6-pyruvoyl-tetrahydropterin synthase-related protein [Terriglobales bacterium]
MTATSPTNPLRRPIPLLAILLAALAVHGPLLLMQLPLGSYDANFHIFFASHYAQHWFNPWNPKWFGGFSQTTYPPLPQQWLALFSYGTGLQLAYMLVQMIIILLLPVGVYRYAKLWVDERAASYAALGSIFLGSLGMLVYQAGQLSTTAAIPLYLNALPYFYDWSRQAKGRALLKGVALTLAGAAAHHVTLLFGSVLFAIPVLILAIMDRNQDGDERSSAAVMSRALVFAALAGIGAAVVLLPYFVAFLHNPITQVPIPHASRSNYILNPEWGLNYWVIPYGALILALPFILVCGSANQRLRPLLFGFWITFLLGLGGTTPFPRWVLGRAYEILTFERFSFWATIMALPFVGLLAAGLIDRYGRRAIAGLAVAAVGTCAMSVAWTTFHPINYDKELKVNTVASFLNRDGHDKYRYLTLGFGSHLSELSIMTDAQTVDGEYNSARMLPEMTEHGAAQLTNAKYYGTNGMASLREMLGHADRYGLKWVFVRDPFYRPLMAFAGWRLVDSLDVGAIQVWTKDDVPPAQPIEANVMPAPWEGLLWGTAPIGSSLLALFLVVVLPERRRLQQPIAFPAPEPETAYLREGVK